MTKDKKLKIAACIFIAAAVLFGAVVSGAILLRPYDDGTLTPFNSSANLMMSGRAAATSAYEFYVLPGDGLYRYTVSDGTSDKIADGDVSCINPADGEIFYISQGRIIAGDYLGLAKRTLAEEYTVKHMSVNGYWVYFSDENGALYKMRRNGSDLRNISPEGLKVGRFSADNRRVLFLSDGNLYCIKSDGKFVGKIADNVGLFNYTSDNLFYSQNGTVKQIYQYAGEFDTSLYPEYNPINAEIFNYCFNAEGNGVIYYMSGDSLCARTLYVKVYKSDDIPEADYTVAEQLPGVTELYRTGYHLYAYSSSGEVWRITADESYKGTVEKLA